MKLLRNLAAGVAIVALSATPVLARPDLICVWSAYGCSYTWFVEEGVADAWMNCGDGEVYLGSGAYGGCPGVIL